MAKYEFIREIFNSCSGNQMRDVDIQEVEIEDIEAYARQFVTAKNAVFEWIEKSPDVTIVNITNYGLPERLSFTRLED